MGGNRCDAVLSKTITSFLMSSAVSNTALMSDACTIERNFSCFDAFLEYTSLRQLLSRLPLECCLDKNATDAARTRSDEFVSATNVWLHLGIMGVGGGGWKQWRRWWRWHRWTNTKRGPEYALKMHLCTPDTRCAITDYSTLGVSTVTSDTILHHDCSVRWSSLVRSILKAAVEQVKSQVLL
mgnify:CR=1 FL=1